MGGKALIEEVIMKNKNLASWGSITVSLEEMGFFDRLFVISSLAGVIILSFPHIASAQVIQESPLVFPVNEINLAQFSGTQRNYLAEALAGNIAPIVEDPQVILLRTFLENKKSPLANEAETLLNQYHYRLIIGIAFAESNFCKIQIRPNNCWGIGGGNPESYETLADGIVRANNLIEKYHGSGMTNPKLMRNRWVGWQNHRWVLAVEQITMTLESQGL